ncbi:MAG: threonine--tRNA ligase, partial [Planctomycetes bacterium]|nr:threonine--tRNA ligase [Planctomycetota bacterium]
MAKVTLPDGSVREYQDGTTVGEIANDIGSKLGKAAIAGKVDGQLVDLVYRVQRDAPVSIITDDSPEGLDILRHSASHIMAEAVGHLFPGIKFGIGPSIEDGFYYDFDVKEPFTQDDLAKIEAEMKRIIEADLPFQRSEMSRAEASRRMEERGQAYKVELLRDLPEEVASFYAHGDFVDLCRGPHIPKAGRIKAFKLLSVAGAYWRGRETNPMLQRIYGTAFATKRDLDAYLAKIEEAKRRDHRVLGKALDLYSVHEEVGPGLVHWHPKGALVRHLIESFWKDEHLRRGYQLVYTPHIASERIYRISGHLENYAENMYAAMDIEGQPYRLKPMNCPGHIMIYKTALRSYRDLPLRYAELGTVYRYERSGVLHGMLRVRGFTQDDSHIFCTREQLPNEVAALLDLVDYMMKAFGYTYNLKLSTRPEKSLGTDEEWEWSTGALRQALEMRGAKYVVDEGAGVFYAPKIDVVLLDALGNEWQGPTIQVDLNLPKRFHTTYVGPDGAEHETVIVHRTVLGSMERFIAGLIEHFAGAFPLWLAPVQVEVMPITDAQSAYAQEVTQRLLAEGFRAHGDLRNEKIGFKIREATLAKVPYMLVVGDREVAQKKVAVRSRKSGDEGAAELPA